MRRTRSSFVSVCILLAATLHTVGAAARDWLVLPSSALSFSFVQSGAPLTGKFGEFEAHIRFDPDDLATGMLDVIIDTGSIDTQNSNRDTTLRSPELFDTTAWPTARFVSRQISANGTDGYKAAGELTIRDITRPVTLPFTVQIDGKRATAQGSLNISRTEFGLGRGQWAGTDIVADEVTINVAIDATAQN